LLLAYAAFPPWVGAHVKARKSGVTLVALFLSGA
jgi:hypothetical protein